MTHHLADSAVEALHHAVGLWMTWRAQTVFDVHRFATHVELVLSGRLTLLAGESVRELAAVVGQQLGDFHRCSLVQALQEVYAAELALIGVDVHEHPSRGAVDGHEQVAPRTLIRHLWQVLDVYVHEAGFVVLEGLDISLPLLASLNRTGKSRRVVSGR